MRTTGLLTTTQSQEMNDSIKKGTEYSLQVDLIQAQESLIHLIRTEYIHRFDISDKKKLTEQAFRKLQSAAFNHGCAAIIKLPDTKEYAPVIVWPTARGALGQPTKGVLLSPYYVDAITGSYQLLMQGVPQDLTKLPVLEFATFQGFFNGNTLMGPVGLDLIKPYVSLYNLQMRKLSLTIYKSVPMLISLLTPAQNANISNAYKNNPSELLTSINSVNKSSSSYSNEFNTTTSANETAVVQGKVSRLDTQFDTNDEIKALDSIMDKCRDSLGIRKEPRYKAERKTNVEINEETDVFKRSEKVQEKQLIKFIDQFNEVYEDNIELINQLDTMYSDNLQIQKGSSQYKEPLGKTNNNE